ncbi:PIN domain-containing protein [Sandaracinobacteroides saxicola]|uniref:Type II toxin-antitoxin system VapC family toxin n=1 Tax=Sandaracinobacteroides saxicola TaxID=2759707 RepID=A0A7G5IH99_9SPHN|nr:hypothetical protein [Sandaracinobacteroides saxicola]QMW22741.1 hypothetical protein H3309_15785 [Sandaracinobacteroides saxicola]
MAIPLRDGEPRLLARMIAATALVRGLPLATLNPDDFADVAGLRVEDWSQA